MQNESCFRCGSKNLWSDYSSSGCNDCGYAIICGNPTLDLAKAPKELPVDVQEMARYFDEQLRIRHDANVRRNSKCAF